MKKSNQTISWSNKSEGATRKNGRNKMKPTYNNPPIGCYFDHANRNNSELSADIIKLAVEYGYALDDTDKALLACFEQGWLNDDALEYLDEASESAIDYLNGLESRSFLSWGNDGYAGAFGLWPNIEGAKEDCEFTSSKSQDYPDDDYRGEWLHISDHGNATLYVRGDDAQDTEVWSVV